MKKIVVSLITAFSLILSSFFPITADAFYSSDVEVEKSTEAPSGNYVDGEVIVTVVSKKNTALTEEGNEAYEDIHVEDSWDFGDAEFLAENEKESTFLEDKNYRVSVVSSDKYSTKELMDLLSNKSYVVHVEPNYYQKTESISNDTLVEKQWHLSSPSTSVHAEATWAKTSSSTPIVAVADTGVNYNHPDLANRMWFNPYSVSGLPGTFGYDFGDSDNDPMDTDGHGTHCAGTIAASVNNAYGIAGISKNAKIMALKVFDSKDTCTMGYIISSFNYIYNAMTCGANVVAVNCSWGGTSTSSTFSDLIKKIGDKGALFSFASGNDGTNVESGKLTLPYSINSNYIVSVGAMTSNDLPASYSSYGPTKVTMFAPGDMILSTYHEDTLLPNLYSEAERSRLLSYYDTANDPSKQLKYQASSDLDLTIGGVSDRFSYVTGVDFENNPAGGSYEWTITNFSGMKPTVYFYVDVTDLNLNPRYTYYVSSMLGLKDGSSIEWEHTVMQSQSGSSTNRFVEIGDRTYFRVIGIQLNNDTSQTIYVDDIGITTANPNTATFGKYSYASGTSMAAPMVTGAIAALAEAYPNDTALERRARLLTCTRANLSLAGKCITMSTLDLSKLDQYVAVSGIQLTAPSKTCRVKKSIQLSASIQPANATNPSVSYKVSNSNYASITQKGKFTAKAKGGGKIVTVTAYSTTKQSVKASVKIKIPKQKVTKLKINKKKLTLKVGKKKKLKVTVSPSYATNKKVKWTSGNKNYVSVSSSGVVKAKKAGKTVKIIARAKDGSGKKVVCRVKTVR